MRVCRDRDGARGLAGGGLFFYGGGPRFFPLPAVCEKGRRAAEDREEIGAFVFSLPQPAAERSHSMRYGSQTM